jgi:ketosteroid isomerase-like protein
MSQENVEIVRRYYEATAKAFEAYWENPRSAEDALNAGDLGPEGAEMARYVHPNIEWKTALTGITYRGYPGLAKGWDQLVDAAQEYRIGLQEVSELDVDIVLAVVEAAMKGKASDIEVQAVVFCLVTLQDGQIIRMDEYLERSEALEAAGLSE